MLGYENLIGAAGVALELVVGAQSLGRREVPAQHLKTFKTIGFHIKIFVESTDSFWPRVPPPPEIKRLKINEI